MLIIEKKRTFHLVNSTVPTDHTVKVKEDEKLDKNLDLAWELKTQIRIDKSIVQLSQKVLIQISRFSDQQDICESEVS